MSIHGHVVPHPTEDVGMSNVLRWVCLTHTMRLRAHSGTGGQPPDSRSRIMRSPHQNEEHSEAVGLDVKRNSFRVGLVKRAEDWGCGSLNRWLDKPERDPRLHLRQAPDPLHPAGFGGSADR